jgi:hypothetical protein
MRHEILGIFQLKHDLFSEGFEDVTVCYDHLSTDTASRYWEKYIEHPRDLDTLLSYTRELESGKKYAFPIENLCIYIPRSLSDGDILRCELLIFTFKTLEKYFRELFHILFRCLGEDFVGLMEEIVTEIYVERPEKAFKAMDYVELLNALKKKITQKDTQLGRIPFVEDLITLQLRRATQRRGRLPLRSPYQTSRLKLNREFMSLHEHDYLDLPNFLQRLEKEGPAHLKPQKTAIVFLADRLISIPYPTYSRTLKAFEQGLSLDEYYELIEKRHPLELSYHKHLVARMLQNDILYYG